MAALIARNAGHDLNFQLVLEIQRALGLERRPAGAPLPVLAHELSARVVLSQPLISWHLRILRLANLVETNRQGREVICRLRTAAFEELHEAEARLIGGTSGIGMARPGSSSEVADVG